MKKLFWDKYKNLNNRIKFVTNFKIINLIFYLSWTCIILGIIIMILGLAINSLNNNERLIVSISGISFSFIFLLVYYSFEYLRRRGINKLLNTFSFINIYNQYLLDQKIITKPIVKLDQFKNEFSTLHARYSNMRSTNCNISNKFGIYELNNKNNDLIFSYFEINELGYKKKINDYLQIIFKTTIKKNNYNFLIAKKNYYKNSYLGYFKKFSNDNFDIFYNNDKDLSLAKKIVNNEELEKSILNLNINVQVDSYNLLVYTLRNILYLLLDVSNFKFYKYNINQLFENVDTDTDNFKDTIKTIDKMVYVLNKSKH